MFKRLAALILVGIGVVPAVASAQEAAPPTTATNPPAAAVPAPAPTEEPTGLGTDGAMDLLANACFNGTMQACDDLYAQSPASSPYETYGDTCAGRQPAGTNRFCTAVFTDNVVQPTPTSTTPPTTVAGTVTPTMAAIHTTCKPDALTAYNADYATKVPPAAQGGVAGLAAEQGMTVDAFLGAVLDALLESDNQITVVDAYQPAETPVGEATLTEYGLLTGRYLDCLVETTQLPQDIFDNLLNTDEGSGTWSGYTITWGANDEGDLTITLTSAGAAPVATAPVTTAPATATTTIVAPTTTAGAPTTTVAGATTDSEVTTLISTSDGVQPFTCAMLLPFGDQQQPCPEEIQLVFNDIVASNPSGFETYIYDEDLGYFSTEEVNVAETGYSGFWACLMVAAQGSYTDYDADIRGLFPAATPADTQLAWDAAARVLCPFLTQ